MGEETARRLASFRTRTLVLWWTGYFGGFGIAQTSGWLAFAILIAALVGYYTCRPWVLKSGITSWKGALFAPIAQLPQPRLGPPIEQIRDDDGPRPR